MIKLLQHKTRQHIVGKLNKAAKYMLFLGFSVVQPVFLI